MSLVRALFCTCGISHNFLPSALTFWRVEGQGAPRTEPYHTVSSTVDWNLLVSFLACSGPFICVVFVNHLYIFSLIFFFLSVPEQVPCDSVDSQTSDFWSTKADPPTPTHTLYPWGIITCSTVQQWANIHLMIFSCLLQLQTLELHWNAGLIPLRQSTDG